MNLIGRGLGVLGIIAVLMGLLWMGQGSGVFPYPAVSPMINQTQWIYNGAGLVVVGIIALVLSRRL